MEYSSVFILLFGSFVIAASATDDTVLPIPANGGRLVSATPRNGSLPREPQLYDTDAHLNSAPSAKIADVIDGEKRVFVRPELFKLYSDSDDTRSIQTAARTGLTVRLQEGKSYTLCESISGGRFVGEGRGARIVACKSGFRGLDRPGGNSFIHNPNWNASEVTDRDLLIENIDFDGINIGPNNGTFHAIKFRMARSILVNVVTCHNVGDCTAFQADVDSHVRNSWAENISNVGFDHWEGPQDASVEYSTVASCKGTAPQAGIMFTGTSTSHRDRKGANLLSTHNRVIGAECASGIQANVLSAGSTLTNVVSSHDTVDMAGGAGVGIFLTGKIVGGRIDDAELFGGTSNFALATTGDGISGSPSYIRVTKVHIYNWKTDSKNIAPLVILGAHNVVTQTEVAGGSYPYAVRTNDSTTTVTGSFFAGAKGVYFAKSSH